MILAAGKGTRLAPLTDKNPKALVEIKGETLLELLIDKMKSFGIKDIIINVHHFPGMIISFLKENYKFNINIQLSHEITLMGTGGGIKKTQWFFNDNQPFLVHNVDVMSDVNFQSMLTQHSNSDCLATLAVSKRNSERQLLFDDKSNKMISL